MIISHKLFNLDSYMKGESERESEVQLPERERGDKLVPKEHHDGE
jgi:hypothetical protein